jgi:asparagine synthase (glutamine-hydrolysing)
MCGILGSINYSFNQSHLDLLKHRGPDDFGLNSFSINENAVIMGHRRLSIIDTSAAGHQPMISACGKYSIIFNGEIYNHLQLRRQLSNAVTFRGYSDTESILYYLAKHGIRGVKDFNGIYSLAFLDMEENKLFLARDPFGVKPLYFFKKYKELIFSSEIKAIKSLIGNSPLNTEALATLLRLRYNPSPDTLYENIFKLRPGHFLEIKLTKDDLPYQILPFIIHRQNVSKKINNPVVPKYGSHLETAVKGQLLSDVEVGLLLSGGIDSALVAALAQKHSSTKLKAFTIGFEGAQYEDEIEDAAVTASVLGLEHHYRKISFIEFLEMIKKCSDIVEEPLATTSIIPMYFLSELASTKVKVVLSGQGADESLGGYTRYKLELLRCRIPKIFRQLIFSLFKNVKFKNEQISRGLKAINVTDDVKRFLTTYEIFTNNEIYGLLSKKDILGPQRIKYYYELLNCKAMKHSVDRMMAIDLHLNLADDLLNYTDKITMFHGLECRVPMLDLELVNFIQSLPITSKLNLNQRKIIHKQFAEQILPQKIINRKKKNFQSPTQIWFKEEVDSIKRILLNNDSLFANIFNRGYVEKIINQHQAGFNREKQIFLLLSTYYFLESLFNND